MSSNLIVFDLDGTLVESGPGIISGMRHAVRELGAEMPEGLEERAFIGPPLRYSFQTLLGLDAETAERGIRVYREYYKEKGVYEGGLYPGTLELLQALRAAGKTICIATSKFRPFAEIVFDHFGLRPYLDFAATSGGTETHSAKSDLIGSAFEHFGAQASDGIMIGDTRYDAEGARLCGMPFIGVLFGYGTQEEMEAEGAEVFVSNMQGLEQLLVPRAI